MFDRFSRKRLLLLNYWYVLLPDFKTSPSRFYDEIEEELQRKELPGLEITRELMPEGSKLSSRREYLCLRRERLFFQVCSTSFGTSWFFSCRFSEMPLEVRLRDILLALGALTFLWSGYYSAFGGWWGTGVFAASVLGLAFLLKAVIPLGLFDLDARLLRLPVIGPLYEAFLRAETYYREDARVMYCDLVNQIVQSKVRDFAGQQNVKEIEFKQDELVVLRGSGILRFFSRVIWNISRFLWAGWKNK